MPEEYYQKSLGRLRWFRRRLIPFYWETCSL